MSADRALARVAEGAEIAAWRDFHAAAPPHVREIYRLGALEIDGALALSAGGIDSLWFNRVIGLGVFEPATAATLDRIVAPFVSTRSHYAINLAPPAEPATLAAELETRGYATFFHHVKWVRDAREAEPVSTPLTVERVTPESALEFARLDSLTHAEGSDARRDWTRACIGRPNWTHFMTRDSGDPAGTAAMYVHDQVAWLGWAATLPAHEGKGSQRALLAARITAARAAGCTLLTLETGPNIPEIDTTSWRNTARAGFQIAYERPSYIQP